MANKDLTTIPLGSRITGPEISYMEQGGNSRKWTADMMADFDFALARQRILPVADTAAIDAMGVRVQTIGTGGPVVAACVSTNQLTSLRRTNYGNDATAAFSAGFYVDGPALYLGDAASRGGFEATIGCGLQALNAAAQTRFFCGIAPETTPAGLEPSALLNTIGIGCDLADTNLQLMHNNGAGVATKIDLGWPGKTAGEAWVLFLSALPFAQLVNYEVLRLSTGLSVSGIIAAELPVSTVFLGPCLYNNNGAGGGAGVLTPFLGYSARTKGL